MLLFNHVLNVSLGICWLFFWYQGRRTREQEKLLAQQERFLSDLSDQYAKCGELKAALEESAQLCGGRLQRDLMQLLTIFEQQEGLSEGVPVKNVYLLLLFSLCDTIRTFGDLQIQGVSLFIYNIRYIQDEVRIELLRRQEGHYAFLGLRALSILPFFVCIPIQRWSSSISASLERFYTGSYGFVTLTLCFFLSVCCAFGVHELHEPSMPTVRTDTPEQRLLRVPPVAGVIDAHIAAHYSRYLKKNEQLKVLQGYGNIREFLVKKLLFAAIGGCAASVWLLGCRIAGASAAPVPQGVLTGLLFLVAVSGICFFLPDAWVVILQARAEYQKMEETLRFETLILIVMHHSEVTVEELLRRMEQFSVVFSRALQRAVDDYSYHRRESLEKLKEELGYEPAKKLADALIACDDIPITQAFYNLEGERTYNLEQFKQKAWDMQKEKAAFARVIAFLPFVAVLVLRLIVPFVLEGLLQLQSYG